MRRLLLIVAAMALLATACGSGSETADPTTTTTTTTEAPPVTAAPTTTTTPTTPTTVPSRPFVEWDIVDAPGCVCAGGDNYKYMVREGDPEKVLLFLQGGGACFTAETCEIGGAQQSYSHDIVLDIEQAESGQQGFGLFEFDNPENPVADWTVIYMPYCTGDVFLGTRTNTYSDEVVINHTGFINASKGVENLIDNYPDASQIFVTGSSAGGVPSPLLGGLLADAFPEADVLALGDGASGYGTNPAIMGYLNDQWGIEDIVPKWPIADGVDVTTLGAPDLYLLAGNQFDNLRLARFDHAYDRTQTDFAALFSLSGGGTVLDVIHESEDYIEASGLDLPTYVAAGNNHTIHLREEFYDLETDGVRWLDWLTAFIDGEDIEDVHCVDCGTPP